MNILPPRLPASEEIQAEFEQLLANPGSVILIAIEAFPHSQNYPAVGWGWFSADERKALKAAVQRATAKREASKPQGHATTAETDHEPVEGQPPPA